MAKRERSNALMIMLTEEEKAVVRAKADKQGMTMSSYARFILLADAKEAEQNG